MMSQVFAKVRIRGNRNKYRKILSTTEQVYHSPDELINSSCVYSPGASLDEGEWFKISEFSQKEFSIEITQTNYESVDYDSLQISEYAHVDYLFIQIENHFFFQKVGKSKLVKRKGIFGFGEEYSYKNDMSVLFINEYPDAVYISAEDTLYFQRLESITRIFDGISELYREATESEVTAFLENDFIALGGDFTSNKVKTANRKRIAMAMNTLSNMQDKDKIRMFTYICGYCPSLVTSEHKFKVESEDDLKMVLYGIEQRFYTTSVGDEKRIAKSVVPLQI